MNYKKFIDSVVGNIARKIEDEFNENDHPRDKGGKFTTKGGEGKGGKKEDPKKKKELLPETETEKAAKEELNESSGGNKKLASKLKEIASDGFSDYPEMAKDFLKTMGVKLPKLDREQKEYYEEYPDEYQDLIMEKVHSAIERDPEAAQEALGEWASDISEESSSTKSDEETLEGLDDYGEKLLEYASDIDTANDALRALNWDTHDYDDLEQAQTALKEAISQNPKAAKELWESTTNKEASSDYLEYAGDTVEGKETDRIYKEFKSSGIDMYAALSDLGLDVFNTPESYLEDAFKEALFNSSKFRKKAASYIKQYRNTEDEEEWFK